MRLLALERIDNVTTVLYRWLDEPLTPPRTLLKAAGDLATIRAKLEQQYFNGKFNPDEFQIVVNEYEPPDLEAVFAGFTIMRLPDAPLNDLPYQAVPLALSTVEALLSAEVAPHADHPEQARSDLAKIMHTPVILTGFSRAAIETVQSLSDLPFELEVVAPRTYAIQEQPVIVAVGSDPGVSREEADLIEHQAFSTLLMVDTDHDPEKFESTLNFITNRINAGLIDSNYRENLIEWYNAILPQRLRQWTSEIAEPESIIIQNTMKLLKFPLNNS